jgi:hypothetical protein
MGSVQSFFRKELYERKIYKIQNKLEKHYETKNFLSFVPDLEELKQIKKSYNQEFGLNKYKNLD